MDSVFSFSEADRLDFLHSVLNTYGCSYVCLWFYTPSSNRLLFLDGLYDVPNHQAMISHQRLFEQYKGLEFDVTSDDYIGVPGLAFRNHQYTCLELQLSDLLRFACTDIQRRFFQEARIKKAVFIGCGNGEIELGFSVISQGAEMTQTDHVMRNLFTEQFSRKSHIIPPSSSSSYNDILGTCLLPEMLLKKQENEHEAIVKAIIHVISFPPPPHPPPPPPPNNNNSAFDPEVGRASAFTRYTPNDSDIITITSKPSLSRRKKQSMVKRSLELYRGLHYMINMRERYQYSASRPTSTTHTLHVISERRRREQLNKNFQALRSLLPPGTKKYKGSILRAAKEKLNSLMAEIENMTKGSSDLNQQAEEAQMKPNKSLLLTDQETKKTSTSNERLSVQVSDVVGSSLSQERFIDLQVTVRGGRRSYNSEVEILLIRLLEFLKEVERVSLVSLDASTTHISQEGAAINIEATFRLKIEYDTSVASLCYTLYRLVDVLEEESSVKDVLK